jgi:hypothetical protein
MTELTIFTSIFDNKTHRKMRLESYDAFEELLYSLSKKPGYKPKKDERFHPAASPLISPAVFDKGDTRKNVNVKYWGGWAALDVDEYDCSFDKALETFSGVRFTCYSSASSTKEKPKFRMVFPLSENVQATDIRHFWFALSKEFNSMGDEQTKDLSRMYYVPAQYPGAYNFIVSNKTSPILNVCSLLEKYDYAKDRLQKSFVSGLPDLVQKQVAAYKKSNLTNTNISWTGINDCPFVNKNLVAEYYAITETGWYRKMFQILLSCASNAIKRGYPISAKELATLGRELDAMTGGWYQDRPLEAEAERAIAYAVRSN